MANLLDLLPEVTTSKDKSTDPTSQQRKTIEPDQWPSRCWLHVQILFTWHFTRKNQTSPCTQSRSKLKEIDTSMNRSEVLTQSHKKTTINETNLEDTNNTISLRQTPTASLLFSPRSQCSQLQKETTSHVLHYIKHLKTKNSLNPGWMDGPVLN